MSSANVLAVSPHLDDAALSAGGRLAGLAASGQRVVIFTVFAGTPVGDRYSAAARVLHRICGLGADPVECRRAEDRQAAADLSVAVRHGDFLDAVYRTRADGGWLIGSRGWPGDPDLEPEDELVREVAATIRELIAELRPRLVLTCASFGDHVDHRHTHAAVRAATSDGVTPVELWSDTPYLSGPVTVFPDALRRRCGSHEPTPYWAGAGPWRRKLAAVARYRSQHALLWPGADDVSAMLNGPAELLGRAFGGSGPCELFWRAAAQWRHDAGVG